MRNVMGHSAVSGSNENASNVQDMICIREIKWNLAHVNYLWNSLWKYVQYNCLIYLTKT